MRFKDNQATAGSQVLQVLNQSKECIAPSLVNIKKNEPSRPCEYISSKSQIAPHTVIVNGKCESFIATMSMFNGVDDFILLRSGVKGKQIAFAQSLNAFYSALHRLHDSASQLTPSHLYDTSSRERNISHEYPCAVLWKGQWQRALIFDSRTISFEDGEAPQDLKKCMVSAHLLDNGVDDHFTLDNIRLLEKRFTSYPARAIRARFPGLVLFDNNQHCASAVLNAVTGKRLTIHVVALNNNCNFPCCQPMENRVPVQIKVQESLTSLFDLSSFLLEKRLVRACPNHPNQFNSSNTIVAINTEQIKNTVQLQNVISDWDKTSRQQNLGRDALGCIDELPRIQQPPSTLEEISKSISDVAHLSEQCSGNEDSRVDEPIGDDDDKEDLTALLAKCFEAFMNS